MPVTRACQHLAGSAPGLLEDLTPSQSRAVETPSATVCVLASAGAGKTRVLTRRIAYRALTGSAKAEHVLAITFTRKAAGELRDRLASLGLEDDVAAGTFHSAAFSQLRRWWADRRAPAPALLQRKGALLAELAAGRPGLANVSIADLASQLEWAKARLIAPADFVEAARLTQRALPAAPETLVSLYSRYEDEKRRRRLMDFDDLLACYADALASDSRFAAAQRWKWRHIFVDELQDVNPLQCSVLIALLGDNEDLFVVGDPHQAIYGWNGSDPRFLLEFPMRWPGAEVVRLDDNHRSSPQVVAAASAVLGRQSSGAMRSSQPDGPLPALRSYASEDAEAAGVAAQMRSAHARGLAWTELAALARTNAQLVAIARALEGAGVPFRSVAPDEEVEGAAGAPRLRDGQAPGRPATPDSGGAAGTSAPAALGVPAPEEAGATLCSFHRAKGLQWRAVWVCGLEAGIVPIGYATDPAALAEERRLLYVALTRAEHELYCSWARQRRAATGVPLRRDPSPWLPTLAAHCAGAEESSSAVRGQDGDAALVDFLAAARRRLSRASRRAPGNALAPSALLGEILEEEEAAGSPRASALAAAERLRQWRRRMARASGVPPHVLMHDATLEVIAARRPSSPEELLTVPGLGPVKVARYGRAILEVVRASADAAIPARA